MNGQEMVAAVRERVQYSSADPQVTDARIVGWLNAALRLASAAVPAAAWLNASADVAAAAGSHTFPVPVGSSAVRRVSWLAADGSRRLLDRVSAAEMDGLDPGRTGAPTLFAYEQGDVRVWPTPARAGTLEVDYTADESTVANTAGSTVRLPAELHDLVVEHACHLAHVATGNLGLAGAHRRVDSPESVSVLRRANAARKGEPRRRRHQWGV